MKTIFNLPGGLLSGLRFFFLLGVFGLAFDPSVAPAQNLVTNGDFETFGGALDPFSQLGAGDPSVTGWDLNPGLYGGNGINFVIPAGTPAFAYNYGPSNMGTIAPGFSLTSPAGGNYFAADGDPTYSGSFSQVITGLTVGQQYKLNFYEGLMSYYDLAMTAQWNVDFGSENQQADLMQSVVGAAVDWHPYEMTFTASADTQILKFESVGSLSLPPFATIDGISLVAVPEPGGGALILGAFGVALQLRRRRR